MGIAPGRSWEISISAVDMGSPDYPVVGYLT